VKVDPRFRLDIEQGEARARLRFVPVADADAAEPATTLATVSYGALCELAHAPPRFSGALRGGYLFVNGWQSWSFGGELFGRERIGRARILALLNLYTDRPGPLPRRGEALSNFIAYLRVGQGYLVLVSLGSSERAAPPLSFRFDRRRETVGVEVLAEGARISAGKPIAEIEVFFAEGYFAAENRLRELFSPRERFERLGFLGRGETLVPGGYESWYGHYTKISETVILRDLEAVAAGDGLVNEYYRRRGKPTVFQIDDGWERSVGGWEPEPLKFPGGMRALAEAIEERGLIPGLWLAPLLATEFSTLALEHPDWLLGDERGRPLIAGWNPGWKGKIHCLDLSLEAVEEYLADLFHRIVEDWGYRYIKLDFLYAGFLRGTRSRGGAAYEHYDRVMGRLTAVTKDSRGRGVAYLGCGAPFEPSLRHFPLMRIGADTRESWERPALRLLGYPGRPAAGVNLSHTLGRSLFDGTVFVNDPDVLFFRRSRMRLSENEKELIALVDFLLASQLMVSDGAEDAGDARASAAAASFTARIIALFDRLAGRRYGAQRIGRGLYSLFSEDGAVSGMANLSNRARPGPDLDRRRPIVSHAFRTGRGLYFEPHTISLYEE